MSVLSRKGHIFLVGNPGLSQGNDIDVLIDHDIPDDVSFVPDRLDIQAPNSKSWT